MAARRTSLHEAALPILASSLLQAGGEDQDYSKSSSWSLASDIEKGIPILPGERSVFAPGRVVGVTGLQPGVVQQQQQGDGDHSIVQNWVSEFSTHILITLLTRAHLPSLSLHSLPYDRSTDTSKLPQVFVVQFYEFRLYTLEYLFQSLQQKLPDYTVESIQSILDNVTIFRAFDFKEFLEAISNVSSTLHSQEQDQEVPSSTLLLLQGLDQSLAEIRRASSNLAAQARLVPFLRTLSVLSRTYSSHLTVVVVNSTLIPSSSYFSAWDYIAKQHLGNPPNKEKDEAYADQSGPWDSYLSLRSVFSREQMQYQQQKYLPTATSQGRKPVSLYSSSVSRSLDHGFDTHLLVSKKGTKMIIEVAKDRVGDSLGRWHAL
ncbi:hypothetical protein LOZ39_006063 [Ophidiomyces ophidiicola]|nr:hypothetical protein LOZ64_004875 [Ophidiomyces ophidiicola]KAI2000068.1 hypothetical protein LOZ50_006235 [Ophidiomyces ophidiicola]KAI2004756.1 hypothetical protein LOZ49_005729 [Ophidiomyces ophidiicola]KAI2014469.1 hypothetical protein LOZ46_005517 [Ophidiomyces ophidiicola]KAI2017334.1 hypothetical protein LOZ45_006316 [Ophidiomyces ophidiicola]